MATEGDFAMRKLCILCVALCVSLSGAAALARGSGSGMGMHHHAATGGAAGTSLAAPGTNSLGTALSSSGKGSPATGSELGTDPALKREDARVAKMIKSICHGC
jgi:hypothetical protein